MKVPQPPEAPLNYEMASANFIDTGVELHGRSAVADVPYEALAGEIVAQAIHDFNRAGTTFVYRQHLIPAERRRYQATPFEFVVPADLDPKVTELALGSAAMKEWGGDFMTVDLARATASWRATDKAIDKAKELAHLKDVHLAIVREQRDLSASQRERANKINKAILNLKIPNIYLIVLPEDASSRESDVVVGDEAASKEEGTATSPKTD